MLTDCAECNTVKTTQCFHCHLVCYGMLLLGCFVSGSFSVLEGDKGCMHYEQLQSFMPSEHGVDCVRGCGVSSIN